VTYDFIDLDNNYLGGAISGLRLRYEALHNYTSKLPLLELENPQHFIGTSTNQSIHSGVVNALVYEDFIGEYKELSSYNNFNGETQNFLAKRLKKYHIANSNFLIESLNQTFNIKSTMIKKNYSKRLFTLSLVSFAQEGTASLFLLIGDVRFKGRLKAVLWQE
jgi:type III pantothenate kinase